MDADLLEDRFEVVLDGVARDEQSLGDRLGVEAFDEEGDELAFAFAEPESPDEETEDLVEACGVDGDGEGSVAAVEACGVDDGPAAVGGGLLAADPAAAPMVQAIRSALEDVGRRLAAGDSEGAAREFTDRVAFGPGTWDGRFTARLRETMGHNAATFLDELRQPGRLSFDADALRQIAAPVLPTEGEQSPPFRSVINERLAAILTDAQRRVVPGVGHDPHVSAPDKYERLIAAFVSGRGY